MDILGANMKIRNPFKQRAKIEDSATKQELIEALGLSESVCRIALGEFAINCAISLIAGLVAKCEFRTYWNGKKVKGDEYYLWNVRPNPSQNSTQFIQELIQKLCWNNEALIFSVGNSVYIADSFSKTEYAVRETEFTNIVRKNYTLTRRKYKASEVIYLKLNNTNVTKLVRSLQSSYNDLISEACDRYIKLGGEKIILKISALAQSDPKYEDKIKKYMNEYFKAYFNSKNAVLPLFEGYNVDSQTNSESKKTDEVSGIAAIKKESMDTAAQAFKIPPILLRGDIADVSDVVDNLLTFGIDPICCQIEEAITATRYSKEEYLRGCYVSIDTTAIKHLDVFDMAANIDKLIACGFYNVDDCLEKAGEARRNTKFSSQYVRTKNYEVEGGENSANES